MRWQNFKCAMPAANTPMPATNASMFTPYAPMSANAYGDKCIGTNALWSYSDALYTSNALHESYAISNVLHASYAGNANDVLADDDAWHDARMDCANIYYGMPNADYAGMYQGMPNMDYMGL